MNNFEIPYLSFKAMHKPIELELQSAANRVIKSNWYILGKEVADFEKQYTSFISCQYGVGVNSGLDGLVLSLKALEIGPGDEVVVASNAYIACWNAIHLVGATIVPVEPDPFTANIDPGQIPSVLNSNTKAIMAVHLYGRLCDMDALSKIGRINGIPIIEDCAQSHGASYNGTIAGNFGTINSTSFYPGKNLGALGDAGIITTNDSVLADKVRKLRNYGFSQKYVSDSIGYNSRLDEMQAAILNTKLKYLTEWNEARIKIAKFYDKHLTAVPELTLPKPAYHGDHVYHIYCIQTVKRNELQSFLKSKGIGTLIHYPIPPYLQKAYSFLKWDGSRFPIASRLAEQSLSLPIYPGLEENELAYICDQIKSFFEQ